MCSRETTPKVQDGLIFVITTTNNLKEAKKLAESLVAQGMAACVSISSPVLSVYRWRDHIEKEDEFMLFIKTVKENYSRVESFIQKNHSYELPEILSVSIDRFEEEYGNWLIHHSLLIEKKSGPKQP